MAFSDLCVSFTGYPMTAISSYSGRWLFGPGGCQFNAFCVFTLSSSTMGTHAALAVYRYIYVCKHNLRK
ncbi:Rhodopsin, G0-coupled [Holothuria leucospilota]|uniref:Rhodopsin, G0-coupled n=1 Tax=Holothuria leucospilota TaxID=206669 RepID=A0A9Q1HDS7_HOLLE|nr:Rhodopsin, G0-coupled [Holothuria leucospilota]